VVARDRDVLNLEVRREQLTLLAPGLAEIEVAPGVLAEDVADPDLARVLANAQLPARAGQVTAVGVGLDGVLAT
jgi:hypothetical protein